MSLAFFSTLSVFILSGCVDHYNFWTEAETPLKIYYDLVFGDHQKQSDHIPLDITD